MDFAMREWLTVIIVLLIMGVLLDGWRRMRTSKRHSIKMSSSIPRGSKVEAAEGGEEFGSELPNGGARVIAQRNEKDTRELTRNLQENFEKTKTTLRHRIPEQVALNLDEEVPMLMESVHNETDLDPASGDELLHDSHPDNDMPSQSFDDDLDDVLMGEASASGRREPSMDSFYEDAVDEPEQDLPSRSSAPQSDMAEEDADQDVEPEEVLVINVMAPEGQRFHGEPLLTVLLECGMRYGDMKIFHRHEDEDGAGELLFSMVNMVVPGTFDLNTMSRFETPGVSFFMTLPMRSNSLDAFNLMARTAMSLAEHLGGELKDENRSVMTSQTLEHCRQRIREFERKQLSRV